MLATLIETISPVPSGNHQITRKAIRFTRPTARGLKLFGLGLVTAGLASCAHLPDDLASDPFLKATPIQTAEAAPQLSRAKAASSGSAKSIEGIPLPVNSAEGAVVANHLQVREVKTPAPASDFIKDPSMSPASGWCELCPPASAPAPWCPPPGDWSAGQFPVEMCPPGYPMPGMPACPPVVPSWIGGAAILPVKAHFPDEYLCDGGDRGYPVRYDSDMRLGLETEDTVAEYTDDSGAAHVKPTNKVCVYAPRFGAVRSISSPIQGTSVDKLASADKFLRGAGVRNRDVTILHNQNLALGNYRTRERASDIDVNSRPSAVDQSQFLALNVKLVNTFQDLQFIHSGQLVQTDEVRLAKGVEAAVTWTRTQFPVIAAQTEQAQEVISQFLPQEIVGIEDRRKPGELRIVKLADKDVAVPGDTITFTIRYDNVGQRDLSAIRIIDNLTPRLQYVEDSETSDLPGRLFLQDNEEGSLILEFHLDDPLPGGKGGVVTFQTKVR